jgi:hypothetical protein
LPGILQKNSLLTTNADGRYQPFDSLNGSPLFSGRWFEVAYFLRPETSPISGQQMAAGGGNGPGLFTLYRRQLVVMDLSNQGDLQQTTAAQLNALGIAPGPDWINYFEISSKLNQDIAQAPPTNVHFNSPADLTMPINRFGMTAAALPGIPADPTLAASFGPLYPYLQVNPAAPTSWQNNPNSVGADVLLTDVLSFAIQVYTPTTGFVDLSTFLGQYKNNTFGNAGGPFVFDTWSNMNGYANSATLGTPTSIPLQINIQAVKIIIRIWDAKTQQARQITIIQDM